MRGTRLGDYTLADELGSGGMGAVWRATAPDGRTVALKIVHPHLVEQTGFRERFLREAQAGLSIVSPNVVRTFECLDAEFGGRTVPALVLEFVEGRDLAALLAETTRVPEDLCRHLAREVARGLEAIHAAGIVHRDLKPGNVLLTKDGDVKVMDLGLARQASGDDRMSQTGLFLGTAAYAPPEQFFGKKELDPRSDLYSLGAMLFELTTGRVPFEATAIGDLVRKVLRDRAPRIGALAPQTTPFFEEIVATLLDKEPSRRFASAAELGEVLDSAESGDWWAAASARLQAESRRPPRRVRVRRESELWGREDDLAELRAQWDGARRGEGAVVLLEGEAGIGKTRLVEELLAAIEAEDDAQIVVGRHEPVGSRAAQDGLASAFLAHLGAEDLEARLRELLPETPLLLPSFAAFLAGTEPPQGADALSVESIRTLLVELTRALAAEGPLVLVLDDLHFATDEGRAIFRSIAAVAATSPVLLVGTARPGLPGRFVDEVVRCGNATRHEVRRLDADTVRAAVAGHLGSGWAAESVAEKVASRAGGNPYFIVEALRHLAERGNLTRTADGSWRVTAVPVDLVLPPTVRELVGERLAALASADRTLLEAASCQGNEFDGRLLAESLGRQRIEILRALGRLEQTTSLVRAAGTRFAFDHHVVHETILSGQSDADRRRNHLAIADALETRNAAATKTPLALGGALCADLAEHLLAGGAAARAIAYVEVATVHLRATFQLERAIRIGGAALAAPGLLEGAARYELLMRHAGSHQVLGRPDEERRFLTEATGIADALPPSSRRWHNRSVIASSLTYASKPEEARPFALSVLRIAREMGDRAGEASGHLSLSLIATKLHSAAEAIEHGTQALTIAREVGDGYVESRAEGCIGCGHADAAEFEKARAHHARHLECSIRIRDRIGETMALGNLGNVCIAFGDYVAAKSYFERQAALCRELGYRRGEAMACGNLGTVAMSMGAPAAPYFERQRALSHDVGDRDVEANACCNLGQAVALSGDLERGEALLRESLAMSREMKIGWMLGPTHMSIASVRELLGDAEGCRAELAEGIAAAESTGMIGFATVGRCHLAALPGGDVEAALRVFSERESRLDNEDRRTARWFLWKATGDRSHLAESKRLLDAAVAATPAEFRETMLTDVALHRDIVAASRAEGIA